MATKFGDPPNPHKLKASADRLREQANSELDPKRREQMRGLAKDLDMQYRQAMRPH